MSLLAYCSPVMGVDTFRRRSAYYEKMEHKERPAHRMLVLVTVVALLLGVGIFALLAWGFLECPNWEEQKVVNTTVNAGNGLNIVYFLTRSTQRVQTSLAEADHLCLPDYKPSLSSRLTSSGPIITPILLPFAKEVMNVEPWWWKANPKGFG